MIPSPAQLLPYGPMALVVDRIVSHDQRTITTERIVHDNEPYGPGFSLEGVIELCAQSAACFTAMGNPADSTAPKTGVLAGVDGFRLSRAVQPQEILTVHATRTITMGALSIFECIVTASQETLCTGTLKVGTI